MTDAGNGWVLPEVDPVAAKRAAASARGRASSRKGATGERDVLGAFRDAMRAVEAALAECGHVFVARSEFATRKRIEKDTSNRDIGNIPLISIEVKRNENLNIKAAWEQCVRQADGGLLPVLVYRYNREPWRVRTWIALTHHDRSGRVVSYAQGEVSLVDFLDYFAKMYREFLSEGSSL